MTTPIDIAIHRSRPVLLILCLILVAGTVAYITIPKESDPDIAIPIIYVSIHHEGISPEDAERLLIRPMESELQNIEGIKEMTSTAVEGHATVVLEFDAGFDSDTALDDVREKVDTAKSELPAETDEPTVHEVNVALFPVLVVTLYGDVAERMLVETARNLRDQLEALPGVLEVDIAGTVTDRTLNNGIDQINDRAALGHLVDNRIVIGHQVLDHLEVIVDFVEYIVGIFVARIGIVYDVEYILPPRQHRAYLAAGAFLDFVVDGNGLRIEGCQ